MFVSKFVVVRAFVIMAYLLFPVRFAARSFLPKSATKNSFSKSEPKILGSLLITILSLMIYLLLYKLYLSKFLLKYGCKMGLAIYLFKINIVDNEMFIKMDGKKRRATLSKYFVVYNLI